MKRGKKGEVKLSFGMIFSIILIILFIAFAFYAISKFLEIQDSAKIGIFLNNFQSDIDKMWRSSQGSEEVGYSLPSKIKNICFLNEEENLVIKSDKILDRHKIKNLDIIQTLDGNNELCIEAKSGKVNMVIKKEFGENLVSVEK